MNVELGGGQGDLVVVDDDDTVHEKIARNLRKSLWSATYFRDPEEALIHLHERVMPDLLMVDNRMPSMDGPDFIDQLNWPAALIGYRVYLCSGVRPPADICARVEDMGAGILLKDAILEKIAFNRILREHEVCKQASAVGS